jgi:hypothetical protein
MKYFKSFNKFIKTYESISNNGKMIGDYFLSDKRYNNMLSQLEMVIYKEDFDKYLDLLNEYYNNGGEIRRVIFSSKIKKV